MGNKFTNKFLNVDCKGMQQCLPITREEIQNINMNAKIGTNELKLIHSNCFQLCKTCVKCVENVCKQCTNTYIAGKLIIYVSL